jgi:hypothetical protein
MVPLFVFYYLWGGNTQPKIQTKEVALGLFFAALAIFFYLGDIKLQTGNWFVYSYQNEKFVFNEWHLGDVLLGYRCGLFLYVPVLLLFVVFWLKNKNKKLVWSYAITLLIVAYVISTWNEYCYGCRLGNRPMIDYFAFFVVPLIHVRFDLKKWVRNMVILLLVFCMYYNQILHYQYRHYLLDWCYVKKEQFWQVFLRTHKPIK